MKRDKLYTATKANRGYLTMGRHKFAYGGPYGNIAVGTPVSSYANGITNNFIQNGSQSLSGLSTQNKPAIYNTGKGINWGQVGQAGQAIAGSLLNTPQGNDLLDTLDPMHHLAGGRESGVGNAFDTAGKGLFTTGVSTGNPWLMLAGAGAKVIGGGINTLFGTKWNKENIARVDKNIADMRNAAEDVGRSRTVGDLLNNWGNAGTGFGFSKNYIGKDGVFTNKVDKKWKNLTGQSNAAQGFLVSSLQKGAGNVEKRTARDVMSNFSSSTFAAFGGPLDMLANNDIGAIGYGFMSDYMNMKNNQVQGNGKIGANYFSPATFAEGGSIHIDPKNEGKFTETMRRTGKTAEELSHSSNPLTRKRAIFALNARKWNHKHDDGGILDGAYNYNNYLSNAEIEEPRQFAEGGYTEGDNEGASPISRVVPKDKQHIADLAWGSAEMVPVVGNVLGIADVANDVYNMAAKDNVDWHNMANYKYNAGGSIHRKGNIHKNNKKDKEMNNIFYNDTLFAFGGDLQTNSSDFGTGLTHIDEGGRHEENPYEGVQYGIASDGETNLVEEGETVFNDYVFSNRIKPKKSVLKQFHMYSNGGKLTYADVSKKLEKEAQERPNDPKSQAALKDMLSKLADAQEEQKAEEEAREARKAFEALSPEEQAAVMQQLAEQQQANEQQENAEVPQEEVPVDENGNPIEQQPQEMTQEAPAEGQPQEALMGAYGGKIGRKYPDGGGLRENLYRNLGFNVDSDWNKWYKDNNLTGDIDWDNYTLKQLLDNRALMDAIKKKSPVLYDALANRGYDFGAYKYNPRENTVRDINNGTWANAKQGAKSWRTSQDPIWSEAVDLYMNDNKLKDRNAAMDAMENLQQRDFENLLMRTNSYQKTNEALHDDANSLAYLNAVLKSDASDAAKNYARKFVDEATGQWKNGVSHTFDEVYGGNGKGVRFTDPGSYWHTYLPAIRKNNVTNLLVNDDGSVERIYGDVPSDFVSAGSPLTFDTEDSGNTLNYYRRKAAEAADNETEEPAKLEYESNPYRYAGLMAPVIGLGLHAAGVGKPDYTGLEASMDYLNNGNTMADYKPIGSYLQYRPYDSQNAINRANATALGVNRGLMNSNSPIGTRNAALLANAMNMQNSQGELGIRGSQYNDAMRQQVASFNRETDKANADAYNRVSLANAEQRQRNAQLRASMAADIANARLAGDAEWNNGLYQGLTSLGSALNKRAKEIDTFNMARAYINSGAAGAATPELAMMLRTKRKSKGGKINKRKRGLTF